MLQVNDAIIDFKVTSNRWLRRILQEHREPASLYLLHLSNLKPKSAESFSADFLGDKHLFERLEFHLL